MDDTLSFLVKNGYEVLFWWVLLEQLGLPIPAAPLFLAAGALVNTGQLALLPVLIVSMVASLLSDFCWYQIGRVRGRSVLSFLSRLSLDPDTCLRDIKEFFLRHGSRSLLVAKFVPGLNMVVPPLAGIFRMSVPGFLAFDGLGALLWSGVFVGLGYQFAHQIEYVAAHLARLGTGAAIVAPAGMTLYIGGKYLRRRQFLRTLSTARITAEEVKRKLETGEDLLILDVRAPFEIAAQPFTLPGARLLPLDQLEKEQNQIPRGREIVLYCYCPSEVGSARAALLLRRAGITSVRPLAGGLHGWVERKFPVEQVDVSAFPPMLSLA